MRVTMSCLISLLLLLGVTGSASADLVGHWKLDEGSGDRARDSSGNGNDGTLEGGPVWVPGVLGSALQFDGNDRVNCGDAPNLALTQAFSIALWVNPADLSGDHAFAGRSAAGVGYAFKSSSTHLRVTTPTIRDHDGNNSILQLNTWQHVAVTFVPSQATGCVFYINGVATDTLDSSTLNAGAGPFEIGHNHWEQWCVGMIDDVRVYDHVLTPEEVAEAMRGTDPALASNPSPATEATDVPRDVVLSWTAGEFAATHDVYFGTSFDDVNAAGRANPMGVLASQAQATTAFDPAGLLDFETTYYWRVDEVNAAPSNAIFTGEVWYFTTEPVAYPIQNIVATSNGISEPGVGPENTVNGSGLDAADRHSTVSDDMWLASAPEGEALFVQYEFDRVYKLHELLVWNYNVQFEIILGFGLKGVTVEYSENGTDWTALGDVEFARATARDTYVYNTVVDLQGVPARYVRLTVNSGWGLMGQYGLSEVRFLYIPAHARQPQPADGATDVDVNTSLTWRAGREAVSHEVYLGTAPDALALAGTVAGATFTPADLQFGSTYYWQIVEVNEADAVPAWAGDVWSFTAQEYAWIDDFESYNDDIEAGTAIFDTWLDGWVNNTGSTVGYLEMPFAETSIFHGGRQSMPLAYDNSVAPFYAEAEREFDTVQNWTGNGADTLVLHVRGNPPVFLERADGTILMGSTGGDIWGTADAFRFAYKRLSGNGSITARVDSIYNTSGWAKGGVMIRESLDPGSKHAMVVVTPGNGVALQNRPTMNQASLNVNEAGLTAPYWVRLTRTGDSLKAERSADGVTWVSITANAAASTLTIPMAGDVYIGLALVSNNAGASPTSAEFAEVGTTGNVTGSWQTADIGGGQRTSNNPTPMYVRIEDSAGKSATVASPDEEIVLGLTWRAWAIPYSELSGVNLGRVEKMVIGVGSKTAPKAGGTGTVYIDDIGFGSPSE